MAIGKNQRRSHTGTTEAELNSELNCKTVIPTKKNQDVYKKDGGCPIATIAGVGLVCPGVLLTGFGGSGGLLEVFGPYKENSKSNAENIGQKH